MISTTRRDAVKILSDGGIPTILTIAVSTGKWLDAAQALLRQHLF